MSCKYCWRPSDMFKDAEIVDGIPHNPGCPVVENNMEDWKRGRDWGFVNPDEKSPSGRSKAYYFGVRVGKAEIENMIQQAAEDEYYNVGQPEY